MLDSSEFLAYLAPSSVDYPVSAFGDVETVLEVGAGAGRGTLELLHHLPHAQVVCLEPDGAPSRSTRPAGSTRSTS